MLKEVFYSTLLVFSPFLILGALDMFIEWSRNYPILDKFLDHLGD